MSDTKKPLFTPNQITLTRFILIGPLFVTWFLTDSIQLRSLICLIFIAIFVADAWDGWVARNYNMGSVFGVYFDPIVDHISYFALSIMLIDAGYLSLWFLFVIISRDLLVVFLKQLSAAKNIVVSASFLAKVKADLVSVPLAGLYLINILDVSYQMYLILAMGVYLFLFKFIFDPSKEHTFSLRLSILLLTLIFWLRPDTIPLTTYYEQVYVGLALLTIIGSGALYFWKGRALLLNQDNSVNKESS